MRGERENGYLLIYAYVMLDNFRNASLSTAFLEEFEQSLRNAQAAGVKLILRFSYNNPPPDVIEDDAPLERVLEHIEQLGPILMRHQEVLAVIQAGFIGQWGEAHHSTHGLDTRINKAIIRDAIHAAFPPDIPVQWRRPPDLLRWEQAGERRGFGFHNDCFLASPDDVGTYTGTDRRQQRQRRFAAGLTDWTPFTAETCDQEGPPRMTCADILGEGAEYHLSMLNGRENEAYFRPAWEAGGCLDEIARSLGYRLRLDSADVHGRRLSVWVTNQGWARIYSHRPLMATLHRGDRQIGQPVQLGGERLLGAVGPGETLRFRGAFDRRIRSGDRICLASPDPHAQALAAYAVRFANADVAGHSAWDAATGRFCFDAP